MSTVLPGWVILSLVLSRIVPCSHGKVTMEVMAPEVAGAVTAVIMIGTFLGLVLCSQVLIKL